MCLAFGYDTQTNGSETIADSLQPHWQAYFTFSIILRDHEDALAVVYFKLCRLIIYFVLALVG